MICVLRFGKVEEEIELRVGGKLERNEFEEGKGDRER